LNDVNYIKKAIKMGNRYHRAKKDNNHEEIANVFRSYGYEIIDISALKNKCDFIAVRQSEHYMFDFGRDFYLVEVKSKYGKLTDGEKSFIDSISVPVWIIRNPEDAKKLIQFNIYEE
jgi:hypothetical protein